MKKLIYIACVAALIAAFSLSGAAPKKTAPIVTSYSTCSLLCSTVTLTNDQILALPNSPIVLVAAPGAGKLIHFISSAWHLNIVEGGEYTNIGETSIAYHSLSPLAGRIVANAYNEVDTGALGSATGSYIVFAPHQYVFGGAAWAVQSGGIIDLIDQPLMLSWSNSSGNFTGGHPDNTLKVTVWYVEMDL